MQLIDTDICIVGAGPGGVAAALKLSYLNIPTVLVDKSKFPRDKVCGDAISGKVTMLLNRLDPKILERLEQHTENLNPVWGIEFISPNGDRFDLPFKADYDTSKEDAPGYTMKRVHFDHFLIQEVLRRDNIQFLENTGINNFQRTDYGYSMIDDEQKIKINTRLLLVANGAQSTFSRKMAGLEKVNNHHAGGIRAYYKNIKPLHPKRFIELHYLGGITPGYFWIFPLTDNVSNVGLGLRTDIIKKRKINLNQAFKEAIDAHPLLSHRFKDAERQGPIQGYGLPLGSQDRKISGDHYMLIGDAGFLIDPLTGEGIGNAFYSGFIAAEQAAACLAENNFNAELMVAYDRRVKRVLGKEMKLSYQLQQILRSQGLANWLGKVISKNPKLIKLMSSMYTDIELRKKLVKPGFWLKYIFR